MKSIIMPADKKTVNNSSKKMTPAEVKKANDDFFNKKAQEAQAFLDRVGFSGLPGFPLKEQK
nr:hypothetical protein [Pedobacter sp. ASV19]